MIYRAVRPHLESVALRDGIWLRKDGSQGIAGVKKVVLKYIRRDTCFTGHGYIEVLPVVAPLHIIDSQVVGTVNAGVRNSLIEGEHSGVVVEAENMDIDIRALWGDCDLPCCRIV